MAAMCMWVGTSPRREASLQATLGCGTSLLKEHPPPPTHPLNRLIRPPAPLQTHRPIPQLIHHRILEPTRRPACPPIRPRHAPSASRTCPPALPSTTS